MSIGWGTYRIALPPATAVARKSFPVRVRLGIPLGTGVVGVQARLGTAAWRTVGKATPKDGMAVVAVVFATPGTYTIRAAWSGGAAYGPVTGPTVRLRVVAG
jgi:hypothetical protein